MRPVRPPQSTTSLAPGCASNGVSRATGCAGQPLLPLAFAQIKPRWRQRLIVRLAGIFRVSRAACCIIVGDERNTLVRRVVGATVEHERRITDIVKDGVELVVEQRQPMFDANRAATFADGGVEIVVWSGRAELRRVALAEALDRIGCQTRFAHRHEIERAQLRGRALRLRIEGADRFERIAKEIEPDRRCRARRIEVENAAARGVIADVAHRAGARIAVRLEPVCEVFHPHAVARRGGECSGLEIGERRRALCQRVDRGDENARPLHGAAALG